MSRAVFDDSWYQPDIDREQLARLTRRSNAPGLLWLSGFWGLLIVLGAAAVYLEGTVPGYVAFAAYSISYGFNESLRHECHHRTPFHSAPLNDIVHWLAGFLCIKEPLSDRRLHTQHHAHTLYREHDTEIMTERPPSFLAMAGQLLVLPIKIGLLRQIVAMALGRFEPHVAQVVPRRARAKVVWSCRGMLFGYAAIIALAYFTMSWWPILLTFGARIAGGWMNTSCSQTQHVGLPENIADHRLNTRTIYLNPVLRFLYWNMNYHAEHHMYPTVPFYNLPKLHALIKDQTPPAYPGMLAVWAELIPALIRQKREPAFSIDRPLPQ